MMLCEKIAHFRDFRELARSLLKRRQAADEAALHFKDKGPQMNTMTTKTLSNSLTALLFSIAFSAAFLLGSVGPAINVAPSASQTLIA
jgi:hypothetical protein